MASETTTTRLGGWSSERVLGASVLDWTVTCLSVLLVAGMAWDGVGHANGRSFAEEGFFVAPHVFFYSVFLGIVAAVFLATYRERRSGKQWVAAVPDGYGYGVVGLGLFGAAGVADYFWHRAFGFEQGFEVLVSPSHLMLGVGAALFLSMPLRSAWLRGERLAGVSTVPVVVSTTLIATIVTLFGGFLSPLIDPYPAVPYATMHHATGTLVAYPLFLAALVLVLVRRFRFVPGSFAVVFGGSSLGLVAINGEPPLVLAVVAAGLVADAFVWRRPPVPSDTAAIRAFTVLVPVAFVSAYYVVVEVQYGIVAHAPRTGQELWTPHVLGGGVVLAALGGLLLSFLVTAGLTGDESTTG